MDICQYMQIYMYISTFFTMSFLQSELFQVALVALYKPSKITVDFTPTSFGVLKKEVGLWYSIKDREISFITLSLDHNDPSKQSHRLTNGPKPSKTIESDGSKTKNHWKTTDSNGQTAKKHSVVMAASKTIENFQWSLQNHWHVQWFPGNHRTCQ